MRRDRSLSTRSCPICRVAMVSTNAGWHCPQCGSAVVGGQPAKAPAHEDASEQTHGAPVGPRA